MNKHTQTVSRHGGQAPGDREGCFILSRFFPYKSKKCVVFGKANICNGKAIKQLFWALFGCLVFIFHLELFRLHVQFKPDHKEYISSIYAADVKGFDVIVIDGQVRFDCVKPAFDKLKDNGIIIFDNSDWHKDTKKELEYYTVHS